MEQLTKTNPAKRCKTLIDENLSYLCLTYSSGVDLLLTIVKKIEDKNLDFVLCLLSFHDFFCSFFLPSFVSSSHPPSLPPSLPYPTFCFRVVCVNRHEIASRKANATRVWEHNSSIIARMKLYPRKIRSIIHCVVVQS